jgi:hypothetical protein
VQNDGNYQVTAALTTKVHFSALCDPALGPMTLSLKESARLSLRPIDQCEIRVVVHSQIINNFLNNFCRKISWDFLDFFGFFEFLSKNIFGFLGFFSDFCTFETSKKS